MIKQIQPKELNIYCDGGARGNPGPAAWGFVVKDNTGKVIKKDGQYIGKATNNVAEYTGVLSALQWLCRNYNKSEYKLNFYLDSLLAVNQLNGIFKIKNSSLQAIIIKIKGLETQLKASVYYSFIKREKNKHADKLVNQVLDKKLFVRV
jgi:ribonuclease HI